MRGNIVGSKVHGLRIEKDPGSSSNSAVYYLHELYWTVSLSGSLNPGQMKRLRTGSSGVGRGGRSTPTG